MASLLEKEGLGIDLPKAGEIRTGTIASISPGQILISVGAKSEGLISGREFELIPPEEFAIFEVGLRIAGIRDYRGRFPTANLSFLCTGSRRIKLG
jgi:small subunit ribosomal protein S1